VSTEIANLEKEGSARMAFMVGRTREVSSSGEIWGACGRVDWPPMSRIVGGLCCVWYARRVGRRALGEEGWRPPSEKESGVRFRMAIKCVLRVGDWEFRVGRLGVRGVSGDKCDGGLERLSSCILKVRRGFVVGKEPWGMMLMLVRMWLR